MDAVSITSPTTTYYSYYNNPRVIDPDTLSATRDGTALQVQDGRYEGGFELQIQVDTDYTSGANTIASTNLGIRTDIGGLSEISENTTAGTAATTAPFDTVGDYTSFTAPLVALNGATAACTEGRVGIYTIYPSYRLLVPNNTAAGTYSTTITHTLLEQPTCP